MTGKAGLDTLDLVSMLSGGSLNVNGFFYGLDQLLAMALGYERIRTNAAYESPSFDKAFNNTVKTGTTASGCTATRIVANASVFAAGDVGSYIRLEANSVMVGSFHDQVRRITNYVNSTTVDISPALDTGGGSGWYSYGIVPSAGVNFRVARVFTHTFEVARNLHAEPFTELGIGDSYWANAENTANRWIAREAVLSIWKNIAYWTFLPVMLKTLALKLDANGLKVAAEFAARAFNNGNEDGQNHTLWGFCPLPAFVKERALFGDFSFSLDPFSTSAWPETKLPITAFDLQIDNALDSDLITVGNVVRDEPVRGGFRKIGGSIALPRYKDQALEDYCRNQTELMGALKATGGINLVDSGGTVNHELRVFLRRLKLTKQDTPVSGPAPLAQKYTFHCLQPTTGNSFNMPTPSTGIENGELIIQTVNQNPYNAFMNQCQE
ncbi:hypothetical protein KKH18_07025 [bacterium]|nr:hypothetical protein [bacterium]